MPKSVGIPIATLTTAGGLAHDLGVNQTSQPRVAEANRNIWVISGELRSPASIDPERRTSIWFMEKVKRVNQPGGLSADEKASLRALVPELLRRADSSPEAARDALQTFLKLGLAIPEVLVTKQNIVSALSSDEAVRQLERFVASRQSVDISALLSALRVLFSRESGQPHQDKAFLRTARSAALKLLKMATHHTSERRRGGALHLQRNDGTTFTEETLLTAMDLCLWVVGKTFAVQPKIRPATYSLVLRWVQAVESIWRRCPSTAAASSAVEFGRSLERAIPASVYANLKREPTISDFLGATDLLPGEAAGALMEGRLGSLDRILGLVARVDDGRERLLSGLRDLCQEYSTKLVPEAVEWVARQIEMGHPRAASPTAADHSQSSSLDYVAVCLLTAWDAASEGSRSEQVLENIRRLGRELFSVDLAGTPGEVHSYDELQHELRLPVVPLPARVVVIRPGVRWSDGTRARLLVRAIVEPVS